MNEFARKMHKMPLACRFAIVKLEASLHNNVKFAHFLGF